jgi:hypothetical protein
LRDGDQNAAPLPLPDEGLKPFHLIQGKIAILLHPEEFWCLSGVLQHRFHHLHSNLDRN